ncbi:MAG TPA: bifunctional metallophosphatase/5'-nucleotidase [Casimicrobiaceae bacterium]|nr:bifunctional metallophosphatase/5'-nucleotidase [Casimicrobiaceae bacterium]
MMRRGRLCMLALMIAVFVGLVDVAANVATPAKRAPRTVTITLVHLNDVYEIVPVEGGKSGGLARVATVIQQLRAANRAVLTTLGGDYLSPSALGTAKVDGQPLAGRQMVDVLNATGIDWATFGNHEFDVSESAFRAHLKQAKFRIVSTNVTDANGQPFPDVATSVIVPVVAGGRTIKIGFIGVTLDVNQKSWVRYRDAIASATTEVEKLRGKADAIVALTHLSLAQDVEFVTAVSGIDLVLGGHEHENWLMFRGPRFTPVIKADANARSLAVATLTFGARGTPPAVSVRLQRIDDTIRSKASVDAIARRWVEQGFEAFRREGFSPEATVAISTEPLDGRESTVRNRAGRLTDLIAAALAHEVGTADVALFNGGSVRIDDVLPPGPVTEYDIIRVLPFGGKVVKAVFDGALLARVLDMGVNNEGLGGFLHHWGTRRVNGAWLVQGRAIDPAVRYTVALPDFLLSGGETNLGFLTRANPQVHNVEELRDIRHAVIEALRREQPGKK